MTESLPADTFDGFSSLAEDTNALTDYNSELHSILLYIGLITVVLCCLLLVFSLIKKCVKMFKEEFDTSLPRIEQRRDEFRIAKRQNSVSSSSSSVFLVNRFSTKPSLSATLRMLQWKEQQLSPLVHV